MLNSDSRSRSAVGRIVEDFGLVSVRPRSRPPTTRITFFRAAADPAFAPTPGCDDDAPNRDASCDRPATLARLATFVHSDRPQPGGPCDRLDYRPAPAHAASELARDRCGRRGICGAISW